MNDIQILASYICQTYLMDERELIIRAMGRLREMRLVDPNATTKEALMDIKRELDEESA